MPVHTLQVNMTKGELTPYMHARVDTEFYQGGLHTLRNAAVLRYGGVTRVPGTVFIGETKFPAKKARWLRFEFNREQVYAIEAGDLYFRFWTLDGRVEDPPGTPVEIVTPYAEADLPFLQVRQSGDVIYIWCRDVSDNDHHQPRTLKRNSEVSWSLDLYAPKDGPFVPKPDVSTTLTPQWTTNVIAFGGTPSGPTPQAGSALAYAFDGDKGSFYGTEVRVGTLEFDFGGSFVIDGYSLTANFNPQLMPNAWALDGFIGGNWVVLDTRDGIGWSSGQTQHFAFDNDQSCGAIRIRWFGQSDIDTAFTQIAEVGVHEKMENQGGFNLTASSVNGINDNTGFQTGDVGRSVELIASDGRIRTGMIVGRTSTTVVQIQLSGPVLPDTAPIGRWRLGAFGNVPGWPSAGAIFEDRLSHANTPSEPLGVWLSVSSDYDSFRTSQPLLDDDGISLRLTGGKLNAVNWLAENRDLVGGTTGSLRSVGRNDGGRALAPANARQRTETIAPSSYTEPVSIENVILFMDFFDQRLYEAAFTYEVEGYVAREVSTLNEHLFAAGVVEIVYLSHPHKFLVGRRVDGLLVFFAYDREQKVTGGSLADFGGEVEAILDLPGVAGTDLWMIVKRTIDGSTVRYVERLAEFWRENLSVQDLPIYAACALTYDGAATDTLTGLDHLVGETVGIWADGRDISDAVVAEDGSLTLPSGVEAEQIVVGLRMSWQIQTLRLAQIGNRDGSGLGRPVIIANASVDMLETAGVDVGTLAQRYPMRFEDSAEESPGDPVPLRTGMWAFPTDDEWRNNGVFVMEGDRMYPATIRGISLNIEGSP